MLSVPLARQVDAAGVQDTAKNSGRDAQTWNRRAAIYGERTTRTAHHCESTLAPRTSVGAGLIELCASTRVSVKKKTGKKFVSTC